MIAEDAVVNMDKNLDIKRRRLGIYLKKVQRLRVISNVSLQRRDLIYNSHRRRCRGC